MLEPWKHEWFWQLHKITWTSHYLKKMFKFFILLLSAFILVVTADDDEIVKSYGKHRFLRVVEGKNYLKMDNGPKFSTYLADVRTKPVSYSTHRPHKIWLKQAFTHAFFKGIIWGLFEKYFDEKNKKSSSNKWHVDEETPISEGRNEA